jgi:division protein CdvB (Snf7/Vps24/ESCRT-III family)
MKTIELSELEKQVLQEKQEAISIEYHGKLIGYYYPAINYQEVEKAQQELDEIMEKVMTETGWSEEELVTEFMNIDEKLCA